MAVKKAVKKVEQEIKEQPKPQVQSHRIAEEKKPEPIKPKRIWMHG